MAEVKLRGEGMGGREGEREGGQETRVAARRVEAAGLGASSGS